MYDIITFLFQNMKAVLLLTVEFTLFDKIAFQLLSLQRQIWTYAHA